MTRTERTAGRAIVWLLGIALVIIGIVMIGGRDSGSAGATTAGSPPAEPVETVDVTFTSDPSGAIVFVKGDSYGSTPVTLAIPKGEETEYRLDALDQIADYDLYKPYEDTVTATEDTAIDVWIPRTTAGEQAAQRQASEAKRAREQRELEARAREHEAEELADAELSVRRVCNDIVKRQLRAPSTAEFPGLFSGGWDYRYSPSNGTALYSSHVDAQNGFGAMIRSNFTCTYELASDTVTLVSFE